MEYPEIRLFNNISEGELGSMFACMKPAIKKYDKNDIIALYMENITGVGIILDGKIEVARESAAGNRLIMAILKKGDTFGEIASFSGAGQWPATVTAKTKCEIMFIPPEKFLGGCERACPSHKRLVQNMLMILSVKAMELNRKVEYLSIKNMRGKICSYLLELSHIYKSGTFILPMNKNELADFLNVSRPSMSREFSRLRNEGIIDYYLSGVRILDMQRLMEMSLL